MTRDEIVKMAKYVVFPNNQVDGYGKAEKSIAQGRDKVFLPVIDMRYAGMPGNDHHFTTEYHRKYVMPALEQLFRFGYREADFELAHCMSGKYDLSYLTPKTEMRFFNRDFLDNLAFECTFEGLSNVALQRKLGYSTPYHELYTFAHRCSQIVNLTNRNGRKLMISGDSQMVPSIRTLACLFEEVWYFDNRSDKEIREVYKDTEFTDVLMALYMSGIERYHVTNLK